jgi:uncharacterized membrane protein
MTTLLLGLILFFAVHLVPTQPDLRAGLKDRLGGMGYQVLFAILSFAGLYFIAVGYGAMQGQPRLNPDLWTPPTWTKHIAFLLMIPAFILLAAAYIPSRLRTAVGHPMLAAIKIWAFAHLLANGDLASLILFGSFLAYGILDRISVKRRAALGPLGTRQGGLSGDIVAVVVGLLAYAVMMVWGHAKLIGVPLLALSFAP